MQEFKIFLLFIVVLSFLYCQLGSIENCKSLSEYKSEFLQDLGSRQEGAAIIFEDHCWLMMVKRQT